jgi:transketolase
MISIAGSGHPGGSLSAIDLITYLYFHQMQLDPQNPHYEERDRFILSKGHCCPALYTALSERGYFPREVLWTLRDIDGVLQGHPDMRRTPGVDMTTGSLGHGLSCGVGIGGKTQQREFRVYVMMGDGEIESGQVWEAAMAAAHYRLDNLVAIIDKNGLQCDGRTEMIMNAESLGAKWTAFNWDVHEIDGHDFEEIDKAIQACQEMNGKPKLIIAKTIKGKGVSFMEDQAIWHGLPPTEEQLSEAISEIRGEKR